jgi:aminocarboxymuconate-semialdehyde decarboxylase
MTVDVHAHFWPAGLLAAVRRGEPWYGWEPVGLGDGRTGLALGDRLVGFGVPDADLEDPARRARERRARGIDTEIVMHVGFLWNHHLRGQEAARHCRETNDELADAQRSAPDALRGLGILPFHAPETFDRELGHLVDAGLGAVAVPASVGGENLDDGHLLPLLERVIEAGLPIVLHPTYLDPPGRTRLSRYYLSNSIGASLECTVALMSLIHSGVFDRHDDVGLVVVQGGGSVPYEIGRFSLRYNERADVRTMREPPEAYLRRVHYDCMVADSDSLAFLVGKVGADRVLVGTDHPFRSDVPGGAVAWIGGHPSLEPDERSAILSGNARRLFGLGDPDTSRREGR